MLTNSEGDLVDLELRHRHHAEVENRIRNLKDCGLERMPFGAFAANAAWGNWSSPLRLCQHLCLDGELARAEPRTLRYWLLHTAGRLVHRSRQVLLRLPEHWPWASDLALAYKRLALLTT
ncbi:MAG: transposase [Actinomycetota bacterium]|nr:transposase [Actinomycetota bacterium]